MSALAAGLGAQSAPTAASMSMPAFPSAADPVPAALVDAVRDALRNFRVPRELARSPLASGSTRRARAESVPLMLREAVHQALGQSESQPLVRPALLTGYSEPLPTHQA